MDSESQTQTHNQSTTPLPPPVIQAPFQFHQMQNHDSGFAFNSAPNAAVENQNAAVVVHTQNAADVHTQNAAAVVDNQNAAVVVHNQNAADVHNQNAAVVVHDQNAAVVVHDQNVVDVHNQNAAVVHDQNAAAVNVAEFALNSSGTGDSAGVVAPINPNPSNTVAEAVAVSGAGAGLGGAAPVAVAMGPTAAEVAAAGSEERRLALAMVVASAGTAISDQGKKKRGRPRKNSGEGGSASAGNGGDLSNAKKSRGRPLGSGKKPEGDDNDDNDDSLKAHHIFVGPGEDICYKIMAFAQQQPHTIFIISASGSICNVTLRQAATSGGNVTYEGRYEIVTMDGSFLPVQNGKRSGSLSVALVKPDGTIMGGPVAGMLVAASPTQVIVGSFPYDKKKRKAKRPSVAPSSNILNFSAPPASAVASSPSQGASSESSEENHDTPLNHGQGPYTNAGQPVQNMSMYSPMNWATPIKMPPS